VSCSKITLSVGRLKWGLKYQINTYFCRPSTKKMDCSVRGTGFEIDEEFENNPFVFGPIAQLVRAPDS